MRVLVVVVMLAGCWSAPRPTGAAALLRRHHAAGDVLRTCHRGDGLIDAEGVGQIRSTTRGIWDEHLLTAAAHQYEVRYDTISASSRMELAGKPEIELATGSASGTPIVVDDRNRRIGVAFEPPIARGGDRFSLDASLRAAELVDVDYPEAALRKHVRFPLHVRRTLAHADALPSELVIDATFVVREVRPQYVELSCHGTQVDRVRHGSHEARVTLTFDCRVRLERDNGRTARWSIDSRGESRADGEGGPVVMKLRLHDDVVVGVPADDPVCVRAAEPAQP